MTINVLEEIKERLPNVKLAEVISELDDKYERQSYRHKNGEVYVVAGSTIINKDGKAWFGLIYAPMNYPTITHSRPLHEFLDGRFTWIR